MASFTDYPEGCLCEICLEFFANDEIIANFEAGLQTVSNTRKINIFQYYVDILFHIAKRPILFA